MLVMHERHNTGAEPFEPGKHLIQLHLSTGSEAGCHVNMEDENLSGWSLSLGQSITSDV